MGPKRKKEQAKGAGLNLEANEDWLSRVLELEEEEETRNGRRGLRNLFGFFLKDETKWWIKALVTVELLNRVVVDLIKFGTFVSNIYYLGVKMWNHFFPIAWSSISLILSPCPWCSWCQQLLAWLTPQMAFRKVDCLPKGYHFFPKIMASGFTS